MAFLKIFLMSFASAVLLGACSATPEPASPAVPPPEVPPPAVPPPAAPPPAVPPPAANTPPSPKDPLAVEDANLRIASLIVNGFAVSDMACKLAGGGLEMLVAGPALGAVIAKKKAALDACAPGGADVSVRWRMAGGRVVEAQAKASDDPTIEACVARVLTSSGGAFDATCRASFRVGRK
jgi:hypothetical protein